MASGDSQSPQRWTQEAWVGELSWGRGQCCGALAVVTALAVCKLGHRLRAGGP